MNNCVFSEMHHNVYLKKNSNCLFNTVYNNYICSLLLKTVYIIGVRSRGGGGEFQLPPPTLKLDRLSTYLY